MKKIIWTIFLVLTSLVLFTGCFGKKQKEKQENENGIMLYYLNPEATKLLSYQDEMEQEGKSQEEIIISIIEKLKKSPDLSKYRVPVTDEMGFQKVTVQESYVSLDFGTNYSKLDPTLEILYRAAIVKSVVQVPFINNVEITMNGQPIMDRDGQVIGIMNEKSFTDQDNSFVNYSMYGGISLYFADKSGKKLVEHPTQLAISNNVPIEQVILEQLIAGAMESDFIRTVPQGTKVIKTSIKDGICYIDLNKKFLDGVEGVKDEVVIYSIVNSLVELPTVSQVQFTIEGERVAKYRETIDFDGFFERRLELVKGE